MTGHKKQDTIDAALALLDEEKSKLRRIFRQPTRSSSIHWLLPMLQSG